MTTVARVRKGALALPEAEEGTHFGKVAFTVRGSFFAGVSKDGTRLEAQLADEQAEAVLAEQPEGERFVRMGTPIGVDLPLASLDVRLLDRVLRQAWEFRAPQRLVAAHRSGARATDGLPAIGRPAATALALAGVTTLDDVARHTEGELLALHGVGPKAIRILSEALAAAGTSFRAG